MKEATTSSPSRAGGPPDGGGREDRKAAQRRKILEAAREVFFRDGFMEANLDEVARLSDVAKGTLYRYFENKAELYVAVLSHNGSIFEERMREAASASAEPAERIRRLGRFYLEHWSRNPEYFESFWAREHQPVSGALPAPVVAEVTRLWRECLQILADVVGDGVERRAFAPCDPWDVANILWTAANGLIRSEHVSPGRLRSGELAEVFEQMVELILGGLKASPATG